MKWVYGVLGMVAIAVLTAVAVKAVVEDEGPIDRPVQTHQDDDCPVHGQSYVAAEVECYLLSSPDVLLNDIMTGAVVAADCDDWPQGTEMECWYDNYLGERAFVLFDVTDRPNWQYIRNWQ